jgi:Ca-activated chloride channel homolog
MSCAAGVRAPLLLLIACTAAAQTLNFPASTDGFTSPNGISATALGAMQSARMDFDIFEVNSHDPNRSPLTSPSGSVSMLDLKAPGKARREYHRGYQLLLRKDLPGAVQHLEAALRIYPSFVAAHNALGTAYLQLNQNDRAREEFSKAIGLDDHLPNSYLDLGIAQLALKQNADAEESMRKASSLAPVDLQLALALAYAEFSNRDYPAVIATATQVHGQPHQGAELVHYFAAEAWAAQDKLVEAQGEIETLLREMPDSPAATQFRRILAQIKDDEAREKAKPVTRQAATPAPQSTPPQHLPDTSASQRARQDLEEQNQIVDAEAVPEGCASCGAAGEDRSALADDSAYHMQRAGSGFVMRASVDEVDIFFAATDHGDSVMDLAPGDIRVRDDGRPPVRITGFRNESQLPLRLGIVLDTSDSVKDRLSFEQRAATKFLENVLTDSRDLAFVVGINNAVVLAQDFTADHARIAHAVNQLAPGGGTALWDAIAFASDKLASRAETQPVARVLVLISDGQDNSSRVTLKQATEAALHDETVIYTVSTRDVLDQGTSALLGDRALKVLSELTGGEAFVPGSLRRFEASMRDVQQVIRGRYLLTYKPASFELDGHYRKIELKAERHGREFKVFARKGYYASAVQPKLPNPQ